MLEFPRLDAFLSGKIFFPIGAFLNKITGFSTQSIAFWLVFMSCGMDIMIAVHFGDDLLGWVATYLTIPFMWFAWIKIWRHLDEHANGTLLPLEYYTAVFLRQVFNAITLLSFLVALIPPYDSRSVIQQISNFMFILGVNMFTMMWPKRTNWATAKYRRLRAHLAQPKKQLVLR